MSETSARRGGVDPLALNRADPSCPLPNQKGGRYENTCANSEALQKAGYFECLWKMVLPERKILDEIFDTLEDWNAVLKAGGYSRSDLQNPRMKGPQP